VRRGYLHEVAQATENGHVSITRLLVALGLVALVISAIGASSAGTTPTLAEARCRSGTTPAVIAGKSVCLRRGQKCLKRLDRQYHRYGFHCHSGRLTRPIKPKPPEIFRRKVDVGGHRLAISCRGKGSPTVLLESGAGVPSATAWILLEPIVAKTTRVCSYDRAGLGQSEPRRPPGPVLAARVVDELHRLLAGAGISPPYVLGGWSLGGFFNRLYTKRYPAEVVGLVGVDGTPIGLPGESWLNPPGQPPIDLIGGPGLPDSYYLAAAGAELAASPDLGARPLVLLTHGREAGAPAEFEALWLKWQKQVALLSTSSILVRVDKAGHGIQRDAPNLTAEAFRQVIAAVRARASLPACAATPIPRMGGTCLDPTSH
jgi:pimeloyl-ACP methyl ester carboxylesterase